MCVDDDNDNGDDDDNDVRSDGGVMFTIILAFLRLGLFPSWVCYSTVIGAAQVGNS